MILSLVLYNIKSLITNRQLIAETIMGKNP